MNMSPEKISSRDMFSAREIVCTRAHFHWWIRRLFMGHRVSLPEQRHDCASSRAIRPLFQQFSKLRARRKPSQKPSHQYAFDGARARFNEVPIRITIFALATSPNSGERETQFF